MIGDVPAFSLLTVEQRLELTDRFQTLMQLVPQRSFSKNLFGGKVWLLGITIPGTPLAFEQLHRTGDTALVRRRIEEALKLGADHGCTEGALGGYTSIVSNSGLAVQAPAGRRA
jgi:hypothetical protein